jgi:hypothetical protein
MPIPITKTTPGLLKMLEIISPGLGQLPQTTATAYDNCLRPWRISLPDGGVITNKYDFTGELTNRFGSRIYPAVCGFDSAGRMTWLKTWTNYVASQGCAQQDLIGLSGDTHSAMHSALYAFMKNFGMNYKRGMPGTKILEKHGRAAVLQRLADFYREKGRKYPALRQAAEDFFRQHSDLK